MWFSPHSTSCKTLSSMNSSSSGSIPRCSCSSPAIPGGSRLSILTYHLLPERVLLLEEGINQEKCITKGSANFRFERNKSSNGLPLRTKDNNNLCFLYAKRVNPAT